MQCGVCVCVCVYVCMYVCRSARLELAALRVVFEQRVVGMAVAVLVDDRVARDARERAVPHAPFDLVAVGRVEAGRQRAVQRVSVQQYRVVEGRHERVRLRNTAHEARHFDAL